MENFDIIQEFKILATKLKSDDRLIYLEQARKMNDMDQELQELVGQFNLIRFNLNTEMVREEKDQEKINKLTEELNDVYAKVMENDSMIAYNECKQEADSLSQFIQAIISTAFNGGDPMAVELPQGGCSGSCSSCSGCSGQ
ncbi:MAG: YlbF family regulator [Oscillospiraceae bacterium]